MLSGMFCLHKPSILELLLTPNQVASSCSLPVVKYWTFPFLSSAAAQHDAVTQVYVCLLCTDFLHLYIHIYTHLYTYEHVSVVCMSMCIYVGMYTQIFVCMHVGKHAYVCIYVNTYTHAYTLGSMHTSCIHTNSCMLVCIHKYMYTCINVSLSFCLLAVELHSRARFSKVLINSKYLSH